MTALALDVGGTKFAAAIVADDDGTPLDPVSVPVPAVGVWDACAALLREVAGSESVTAVGIASAGPVDARAGTVAPINIAEWASGFALADAVRNLFPGARVELAMDGAAAALAEQRFGAGRSVEDLLGVVVGTGVGGGLVLGGRIVRGRTGNAGHIGHMVSAYGTEVCACGGAGCLETVASGPAAVRWARKHGWDGPDGAALAADAEAGSGVAAAALERAGTALGQVIASAAALTDVSFAVVGGGFARSGAWLWRPMLVSAARHARLSFVRDLRIVPAELDALGTLTGAAQLAASHE
ncbi:ROK family protein [Rhodococcus chondri]|uniref:ROK family protein n=1 Tax=Rhodococcus chondri TaxID=3065941 RepID=A0ABU7JVP3_9NOCA|nr:ROK family protein [Rhodococcus sp. CC-R104]MEE2034091.1 ROK family protein [Rhodococcus sp. CC-R104]